MDENFSLRRVLEIRESTKSKDLAILRHVYKEAKLRIREAYNKYLDYCYYTVPPIVPRLPPYDREIVTSKLNDLMNKKGFDSKIIGDKLFFEWNPKEKPRDHIPHITRIVFYRIEYEAKNGNDYLFYEVPALLPEFPWYNTLTTAEEVAKIIAEKGFLVKLHDSVIFICWNKNEIEKNSNIKITYETTEEKRMKALEKIELINENRYSDFVNPKRSNKFDVTRVLHLYN